MSYNYFAATLPMIQFNSPPPMTSEDFTERCREHLKPSDFEALSVLFNGGATSNTFVGNWQNVYTQMRNAVVKHRASKSGGGADTSKWIKDYSGFSVAVENGVAAAFQEKDPLRREEMLDKLCWDVVGELAGFDPFSAAAVFAYGVRLKILEKRAAVNPEEGEKRMREMSKKGNIV